MAQTSHRRARWRAAFAAVGMAALAVTGLPGDASAQTPPSDIPAPASGFKVAQGARIAADPMADQVDKGNILRPGTSLVGEERLTSTRGQFNISMFDARDEGRLPMMYSRTCGWTEIFPMNTDLLDGSLNSKLSMQSDGNLVYYQNGKARWNSRTNGNPGAYLALQTDGNLVVYSSAGRPLWFSGYKCDLIFTIENRRQWEDTGHSDSLHMLPGDVIMSPNGSKRLTLQTDGNLVLYRGSTPLWHTHTWGNPGSKFIAQGDGNFVLYSNTNKPLWYTRSRWTSSNPNEGYQLMVLNNGNLVNYHWNDLTQNSDTVQWQSGTSG